VAVLEGASVDLAGIVALRNAAPALLDEVARLRQERDEWVAVRQHSTHEQLLAKLAAMLAENADLRALLLEARSRNPEHYRSSSDDSGTHGAETGGELLQPPSSDGTRVAPSGEGSGQPVIREGWCPHCGVTRIEDYSHDYLPALLDELEALKRMMEVLLVASERVAECEGWDHGSDRTGWSLLPYQSQFMQAIRAAKEGAREGV
jgi:hypothetical protein